MNEPTPSPGDDLAAFLDGELEADARRAVEERLARDPAARAEAHALKATFDLLDYLPRPEPSPGFAARTVTHAELRLSAVPVAVAPHRQGRPALALVAAVLAGVLVAFAGGAGLRGWRAKSPVAEPDLAALQRVCSHLPWYLGVDDLDYLAALDHPDLFPAAELPPAALPAEGAGLPAERLVALFQSYPPERQRQLQQLDRQFYELPPLRRAELGRVMESYAVWLDHLPELERQKLLAAPTAAMRLDLVRESRQQRWREGLSASKRKALELAANSVERVQLAAEFRQAESARRDDWQLARRQWGVKAYPFGDAKLAEQADEFVKRVLKANLASRATAGGDLAAAAGRLSGDEFKELRARHEAARKEDDWLMYAACLYRLAQRHPTFPEPAEGEKLTDPRQLIDTPLLKNLRRESKTPNIANRFSNRGKWPEYALEVAAEAKRLGVTNTEALGPCRPGTLPAPVKSFCADVLVPKLTDAEKQALAKLEGRWPDYPQQLVALARRHDLPVPGVTLPGSPAAWERCYGPPAGPAGGR